MYYPLTFKPVYKEKPWGCTHYSDFRSDAPEGLIGESWDVCNHANGMSVVSNGYLAGKSLQELIDMGKRPYYLYGGGHNRPGVLAYKEAMQEFKEVWPYKEPPASVFLASGTGSTQAGLLAGCRMLGWSQTRIRGISVARTKERGHKAILESLAFVDPSPETYQDDIYFDDRYIFGAYGQYTRELTEFTSRMARETGLILDNTYTGKAFYGMLDLLSSEQESGPLVFWHTGGLMNLMH